MTAAWSGPLCHPFTCGHVSCARIRGPRLDASVEPKPGPALRILADWLIEHLDAIRLDESAAVIHDEITSTVAAIERAIDRQDPDHFVGRCGKPDVRVTITDGRIVTTTSECGANLYEPEKAADELKCGKCGAVYKDWPARKEALTDQVNDVWATAQLIADALSEIDAPLNASTLRTWIERDAKTSCRLRERGGDAAHPLVLQVGIDDDGRALYRVGDVRARIAALKPRKGERVAS